MKKSLNVVAAISLGFILAYAFFEAAEKEAVFECNQLSNLHNGKPLVEKCLSE
jgi:hypothetical protein